MDDQYFGHKELYEVVLRAKNPMQFGARYITADEPVLYFNNVNMSLLTETNRPVFARGGWGNVPRVVWDERDEVQFQMVEGVMSSVGMGILLGANVLSKQKNENLYINKKEGPFTPKVSFDENDREFSYIDLKHRPVSSDIKKSFIFQYDHDAIQKKMYGKYIEGIVDGYGRPVHRIKIYEDQNYLFPAENNKEYVVDYYYKYEDNALSYKLERERFNGLFTLEAKFYSQDENEGKRYTNILYMPKVRIVSSINLRLGERADPTVSTFNIIGLPETVGKYKDLIVDITRLGQDIDSDI